MTTQQEGQADPIRRRVRQVGTVASVAGSKSVVVRVDRTVRHGRYEKYVRRQNKVMAHDEGSECRVGDLVEVVSSRPLSARKRWRVARVVRKAVLPGEAEV
jgi:small subunit ribosomal protein S17